MLQKTFLIFYICAQIKRNLGTSKTNGHKTAESFNKNNIVIMRTVLKLNFFFPFSQKLPLLQESTRNYTLNKKINSQRKIPAKKKTRS